MKISKRKIAELEKCYAICPITIHDIKGFLVATEKLGPCFFFNEKGEIKDRIWEGPGGVMSMVPVPGGGGAFFATQAFYSPNDSKEASIVLAQPVGEGWQIKSLIQLPFVHRFNVLRSASKYYLIACQIKGGHDFKNDWNKPGKVLVRELPDSLKGYEAWDEDHPMPMEEIGLELKQNHGYFTARDSEGDYALISSKDGIFEVHPPVRGETGWRVHKILDQESSDALLFDLDGDGEEELITFSSFHGDHLDVFKKGEEGGYLRVWAAPEVMPFLHAIWGAEVYGEKMIFIGHRKGKRNSYALRYRAERGYYLDLFDQDVGATNFNMIYADKPLLIGANREVNEVALYSIESL